MNERRGGLGRGLAALIPSGPSSTEYGHEGAATPSTAVNPLIRQPEGPSAATDSSAQADEQDGQNATEGEEPGAVYRELPVTAISPNPRQPRTVFDEESLAELEHSIREFGLMQPIVVRELDHGTFELIMGERRWRAAQRIALETIPAIVRQTHDDGMLRDALLENIHRVQLNPLEEASAYQQLLEEFEVTHDELADRIGRSRPVITNTIRLLRLPVPVQRRVAAGVLSAGHARALLTMEDPEQQENLATRVVAEGLSVRATEEAVTLTKSEEPSKSSTASRRRIQAPGLQDLAERLSDKFDTRVRVDLGRRKGRVTMEFGSIDDLERIVGLIAPDVAPRVQEIDEE